MPSALTVVSIFFKSRKWIKMKIKYKRISIRKHGDLSRAIRGNGGEGQRISGALSCCPDGF